MKSTSFHPAIFRAALAALAISAAGFAAHAQDTNTATNQPPKGPRGPRPDGHRPPPPLMVALDGDKNGSLSPAEIAASSASLRTLDKNNDGSLTKEEVRPPRPAKPDDAGAPPPAPPEGVEGAPGDEPANGKRGGRDGRRGGPGRHHGPPPVIAVLDADRNMIISSDEINNAPTALKTLDKNNDGSLTAEELHPPRPEGERGGKGKHRRGGPDGEGACESEDPAAGTTAPATE